MTSKYFLTGYCLPFYSLKNIFWGAEVLHFKRTSFRKRKIFSPLSNLGHRLPFVFMSLQSHLIWKRSSVCFCFSHPWHSWRIQFSYFYRMFFSLGLLDVFSWLVWSFWAGILQKWCCVLLSAMHHETHDSDLS